MSHQVLFIACILFSCIIAQENTLKKVILITRHGDRSPIKAFPNTHQWPHKGHLTGEGMNQLYKLGSKLREEYIEKRKFLSSVYNYSELFVRATLKERTLVSAQSLLIGLYPPGTGPMAAPKNHLWYDVEEEHTVKAALPHGLQAIPIHSENAKNDYLLYAYKNCKITLKNLDVVLEDEWAKKEQETHSLREELAKFVGLDSISLKHASAIYHAIKADIIHGLKNNTLSKDIKDQLIKMKDWVLQRKYSTREHGRLGSGILLSHIVDEFNNLDDIHKFKYYSGHDGTLLSLFAAMGIKDFDVPHYGASIIFEYHQNSANEKYIKILYNDKPLLPECNPHCSHSTFTSLMKDGMLDIPTYKSRCIDTQTLSSVMPPMTEIIAFLIGIILTVILYISIKPRKEKDI